MRGVLQLEGVEPLASPDDCLLAEQIAKEDPKVREQLKLRGVTDVNLVACDPWSGALLAPIQPSLYCINCIAPALLQQQLCPSCVTLTALCRQLHYVTCIAQAKCMFYKLSIDSAVLADL